MKYFRLLFASILFLVSVNRGSAQEVMYHESPELAALVASGALPPVEDRLPTNPLIVNGIDGIGEYGGVWRMGLRGGNDIALLIRTIGYEGLVRWNPEWTEVIPNVAERWEINETGSEFTFFLREGIKWSDGVDFTANDIVFWYEAHATKTEINPSPPNWMITGGEVGRVEAIDDYTVKFTFTQPNGLFLQNLATPSGIDVVSFPEHALSQYHPDYNPDGYQALTEAAGLTNWFDLWRNASSQWLEPLIPTLNAWVLQNGLAADSSQVVAVRNPYFWKVDSAGNQYPYIDSLLFNYGENSETLLLQALNGEIDMMDRHIGTSSNRAVLFDNREVGGYEFFETTPALSNIMVLALNLTHQDPIKREIFQNKDFRIGLSYAINRQELIDLVLVGQGEPFQISPRPTSPLYNEQLARQFTEYDVELANEHLDMAGYTERDTDGFRLGPDGQRISFIVEVISNLQPEWVDMLELIVMYWEEVGIEARVQIVDRSLLYERKAANLHDANVFLSGGGLDVILEPTWYFPFSVESNFAEAWQYWYNGDPRGEEPSDAARRQMELYDQIKVTVDTAEQNELMAELLQIAADEFYAIGISLMAPGYGIKNVLMENVPTTMPFAWLYPHPGPTNPFTYYFGE